MLFAVAISGLVLTGAGCGSASTPAPAAKPSGEVPARTTQLSEVTLPADFPADVLRYENSNVFSFIYNNVEQPGQAILSLNSGDKIDAILEWYGEAYVENGFTKGQSATRFDTTSHEFIKDDVIIVVTVIDQSGNDSKNTSLISVRRQLKTN